MGGLSIIIPVYKEPFLDKTIDSLLNSCVGDVEILVVFDGSEGLGLSDQDQSHQVVPVKKDPRVKTIVIERVGMRGAINTGLANATGDHIMKCDAHCLFAKGFDKVLIDSCDENWLIVPRRYSLDEISWERNEKNPIVDYHFLNFPIKTHYGYAMSPHGYRLPDSSDDTMSFQGSCWLANREYFMKQVGFLDDRIETYGGFAGDQLEMGLKYWLNGGAIKVNKKTWYAHLSKRGHHYVKGLFSRTYKKDKQSVKSYNWAAKHWINNEEPDMIHPFSWLIEKFSPIPTWTDDWQDKWNKL